MPMWTFKFGVQFQSARSAPRASQVLLVLKNPPANPGDIRDLGLTPGSGISLCLENPMDRGAWRAMVHRVAESDTTEAT